MTDNKTQKSIMIILFTAKIIFSLFIIFPLMLIAGAYSLIEEYCILRPKVIRDYIVNVSSAWSSETISRDKIVKFRVERMKGGIANIVRKISITLSDSDKPAQIVFKKYRFLGSIYCFIGSFLGPFPSAKILTGQRQRSEKNALEEIASIGIPVPEVLYVDTRRKITLLQFIEGKRLDRVISEFRQTKRITDIPPIFYNYGLLLATIHGSGRALIDANPFNLIYTDLGSKIYFVDLELSSFSNKQDWDLAYSLSAIEKTADLGPLYDIKKNFLDGYAHLADRTINKKVAMHQAVLQKYDRLHRLSRNIIFK
jgi:tRNA A-37 threonylcarbamoyl transferase component Bud32